MILLETALRVIQEPDAFKYEDLIESYQFVSDNWEIEKLPDVQQARFNKMVEAGLIQTAPWRKPE